MHSKLSLPTITQFNPFWPTPSYFHPHSCTPTYSYSVQATLTHFKPLSLTPTYSYPLWVTLIYSHQLSPTSSHSYPLSTISSHSHQRRVTADLVTFTGEVRNGKIHFLCSALTSSETLSSTLILSHLLSLSPSHSHHFHPLPPTTAYSRLLPSFFSLK